MDTKELREIARKLLADGRVKLLIGFEEGSLPLRASPAFIRRAEDAERLIWNSFCENNLASYLRYYLPTLGEGEAVGIVAKGCDARSVVCLLKEKQLKRDQVVIIGVKCEGMVDWKKIRSELAPDELVSGEEDGDEIVVRTRSGEKRMKRADCVYDNCKECERPEPVVSDYMIDGHPREIEKRGKWARIKEFEKMSPEERWQYFVQETSRCLRCYACRNACPVCYCSECFTDSTMPYWVGTTLAPSDVQVFHLVRAFHTAGRCTSCGNCSQVCPVGIDISFLVNKLGKDVEELFSHEVGVDIEEAPPLSSYSDSDTNEGFS